MLMFLHDFLIQEFSAKDCIETDLSVFKYVKLTKLIALHI